MGFSDHTQGSLAASLALAQGAVLFEKHLTMTRSRGGPDDLVACEPPELAAYIRDLRQTEGILGDGRKRIMPGEEKWRQAGRKSVVALRTIQAGEVVHPEMVDLRRPSDGLHPRDLSRVIGRRATMTIAEGASIRWDQLEGGAPGPKPKTRQVRPPYRIVHLEVP